MKHYVGLDVSMKTTFICVVDEAGQVIHEGHEKTDPYAIADYLEKKGIKNVFLGFESGSLSHYFIKGFRERNLEAVCMDARQLSAILSMKINKTDKNDARGIAEALRAKMYRAVQCKPTEAVEIKVLLNARKTLVMQQIQLKNCVRGILKPFGVRLGSIGNKKFTETVKKSIESFAEVSKVGVLSLLTAFDHVTKEIDHLNQQVQKIASADPEVQRLMTIPGIGPITSLAYKIEIFDASRFKNSRSVGAYLGMTPKQYASGETQKQGRISKCGSNELRSLLVEAAIVLITRSRKWSKLKAWGVKIMKKKGLKKAALAVGRKLAVIMHQMMIQGTEFVYGEQKAA